MAIEGEKAPDIAGLDRADHHLQRLLGLVGAGRDAGMAGQRSGEQQVPGHAGTCGLLAQGSEIAQFLGQLVDAEHRF